MQLVFNELSLNDTIEYEEGISCFYQFINTYSKAVKEGFDRAVRTYIDFNVIPIADHYHSYQWRNREMDRDIVRRYQGLCDRQDLKERLDLPFELYVNGKHGEGILYAVLHDEVLFSISGHDIFKVFQLEGMLYSLEKEEETTVEVVNVSSVSDIEDHKNMWQVRKRMEVEGNISKDDFIKNLSNYYPNLVFGDLALKQLKVDIEQQHFKKVRMKLNEIESVFRDWDGGEVRNDMFASKMSPQSPETLNKFRDEHTFEVNGEAVLASYHIRYTGNIQGRIYFYPNSENKKCYICSLTTKLPTVSAPKMRI